MINGYGDAAKAYWSIASQTARSGSFDVSVLPCVTSGVGLPGWMSTWERQRTELSVERRKLTLDTAAPRLERAHVALNGTLANELVTGEVCIVGRGDEVLGKRVRQILPVCGRKVVLLPRCGVVCVVVLLFARLFFRIGKRGIFCGEEEGRERFERNGCWR